MKNILSSKNKIKDHLSQAWNQEVCLLTLPQHQCLQQAERILHLLIWPKRNEGGTHSEQVTQTETDNSTWVILMLKKSKNVDCADHLWLETWPNLKSPGKSLMEGPCSLECLEHLNWCKESQSDSEQHPPVVQPSSKCAHPHGSLLGCGYDLMSGYKFLSPWLSSNGQQ